MYNSRMNARVLPALAVGALLLSACDHRPPDGEVRSETRDVGSFASVDMQGDARLEITIGPAASLSIKGRDAYVRRLSTKVRGDTLYVRSKRRDWLRTDGDPRLTLRITVPSLESLTLHGGNDVDLSGFSGGKSQIKVQGAASIKALGRLDELTVHVAGAGRADFSKLATDVAKVTVDGVGSVDVNAMESLDATMNGVGAIFYSGNPRDVNTAMNGLGTIARRDRGDERKTTPPIDPDDLQPEYEKESPLKHIEDLESTEPI